MFLLRSSFSKHHSILASYVIAEEVLPKLSPSYSIITQGSHCEGPSISNSLGIILAKFRVLQAL